MTGLDEISLKEDNTIVKEFDMSELSAKEYKQFEAYKDHPL